MLFDGVCNLCNCWVNYMIGHDPEGRIQFAPLQSKPARQELQKHSRDAEAMDKPAGRTDGTPVPFSARLSCASGSASRSSKVLQDGLW
ncbi:MAG: thiol-disulfide oxidoreductase DCC family protein [Bacteroidota bacterium]